MAVPRLWDEVGAVTDSCEILTPLMPLAWESELTDQWIVEGHVEPSLAVLAMLVHAMLSLGTDFGFDVITGDGTSTDTVMERLDDLLGCTRHVWLKPDPNNDELMKLCEPNDPEAGTFTIVNMEG